ncbi:MAG: ribonuclease J [Bacteroidetes bacterium]|nr:ribonuclease J [Bacteroidota bacterium]
MDQYPLKVTPLGGVGEIGKNMMVLEYGDDALVIDAGLKFPDEAMLGVDLVIPDITYLEDKNILGIVLTHGHEDHIGALPYLLPNIDAPIYATRLTRGLVEVKLREHGLLDEITMHTIQTGEKTVLGPFTVECFAVNHSIPDCVGLAIDTPQGLIVHTGDFKFDQTPIHGPPTDFATLAELGRRGAMLLLCDCVRADCRGFTPSERSVADAFDTIFYRAPGRIIVTTFASNISRIQQVLDFAYHYDRKVVALGRSMESNLAVAAELGFLDAPNDTLIRAEQARRLDHAQLVYVVTGSQGEPTSVLSRIATNDHRLLRVRPTDTVIFSASAIPGNEETVSRAIDNLARLGADVINDSLMNVHVSGHGSREELKLMLNLVRPQFCAPVHCGYRHMALFRKLATELGIPYNNVLMPEIGQTFEIDGGVARLGERVPSGQVLVDGLTVGEIGQVVLRDRQHLARDGVVIVVMTLDRQTGRLVAGPDIYTRGFVYAPEAEELLEAAKGRVSEALDLGEHEVEYAFIHQKVREELAGFFYERTGLRPMILPVITEV